MLKRGKLNVGVDGKPRNDDIDKHHEQDCNEQIGYYLECFTRHGAVLMQMRAHRAIVVGDGAQVVLYLISRLATNGLPRRFFLNGLRLLDRSWLGLRLRLLGCRCRLLTVIEWRLKVHATIGTKTDAAGNLFTAAVAVS